MTQHKLPAHLMKKRQQDAARRRNAMNTKSVSGWTFLIFEPLENGTSRLANQGTVIRELGERLLVSFAQPAPHSRIISAEEAANLVLFPSVEAANEFLGVVFNRSANEAPPDEVPPAPESDEDSYEDPDLKGVTPAGV